MRSETPTSLRSWKSRLSAAAAVAALALTVAAVPARGAGSSLDVVGQSDLGGRGLNAGLALADLNAALDWLRDTTGFERLGTIGFCMGGTFVLQLAARRQDLASACFYGFPAQMGAEERAAVKGPVLGFWGDQDAGVGMANVEQLRRELAARGVEHDFTIYPGLGHGFMKASGLEPGGEGYDQACEAWTRTLDFYRGKLA